MLIKNWRQAWRWSSVRVAALGAAACGAIAVFPDLGLQVWNALPAEVIALLPAHVAGWVPVVFNALIIAARVTQIGGADDGQ